MESAVVPCLRDDLKIRRVLPTRILRCRRREVAGDGHPLTVRMRRTMKDRRRLIDGLRLRFFSYDLFPPSRRAEHPTAGTALRRGPLSFPSSIEVAKRPSRMPGPVDFSFFFARSRLPADPTPDRRGRLPPVRVRPRVSLGDGRPSLGDGRHSIGLGAGPQTEGVVALELRSRRSHPAAPLFELRGGRSSPRGGRSRAARRARLRGGWSLSTWRRRAHPDGRSLSPRAAVPPARRGSLSTCTAVARTRRAPLLELQGGRSSPQGGRCRGARGAHVTEGWSRSRRRRRVQTEAVVPLERQNTPSGEQEASIAA